MINNLALEESRMQFAEMSNRSLNVFRYRQDGKTITMINGTRERDSSEIKHNTRGQQTYHYWPAADEEILKQNYDKMNVRQLQQLLSQDYTYSAVRDKIVKLKEIDDENSCD